MVHQSFKKNYFLTEGYPGIYIFGCDWHICEGDSLNTDAYYKEYQKKGLHIITAEEYLLNCLKNMRPLWFSVTCINKDLPVAHNLFPVDERVKRGEDLHALFKLINCHKEMAWSNHIDGIYHRDSVNMVKKSAKSNSYLMSNNVYKELTVNMNRNEKRNNKQEFHGNYLNTT